jgi:hypothetical protein
MSKAENPFARGRAWVERAKFAGVGEHHHPSTIHAEELARHAKIEGLARLFQQTNQVSSPVIEGRDSPLVTPIRTPAVANVDPGIREL